MGYVTSSNPSDGFGVFKTYAYGRAEGSFAFASNILGNIFRPYLRSSVVTKRDDDNGVADPILKMPKQFLRR